MSFLPGTKGARRQLSAKVLKDIFTHWSEVEPGTNGKTRGEITLTILYREEPATYAKLVAALLPRDLIIESAVTEMDDG
jgi:hypothetical protein